MTLLTLSAAALLASAPISDSAVLGNAHPEFLAGSDQQVMPDAQTTFEKKRRRGKGRSKPRIPGGSGCDDPGDILEHPECAG